MAWINWLLFWHFLSSLSLSERMKKTYEIFITSTIFSSIWYCCCSSATSFYFIWFCCVGNERNKKQNERHRFQY